MSANCEVQYDQIIMEREFIGVNHRDGVRSSAMRFSGCCYYSQYPFKSQQVRRVAENAAYWHQRFVQAESEKASVERELAVERDKVRITERKTLMLRVEQQMEVAETELQCPQGFGRLELIVALNT